MAADDEVIGSWGAELQASMGALVRWRLREGAHASKGPSWWNTVDDRLEKGRIEWGDAY